MLAPDLPSAKQALSDFAAIMKAIVNYDMALSPANFAPVDVGEAKVDLLANHPNLKANLATALQHAEAFASSNPILTVVLSVNNYNSTFQTESGKILNTLEAALQNPGMQATPAEQQSLSSSLQSLLSALTTQQQAVQQLVGPAKTFQNQLTADYTNLLGGETSISTAISSINQWVLNESEKFMAGPGGEGIANTIAQGGHQITTGLNNVLGELQNMASENETASQALSDVLTIWQTLIGKYNGVLNNLQQAGGAGILEAGDIRAAQLAWQQLANYTVTLM